VLSRVVLLVRSCAARSPMCGYGLSAAILICMTAHGDRIFEIACRCHILLHVIIGVYGTWAEAEAQVVGFKGAQHKAFPSKAQAIEHFRSQDSIAHLDEEPRLAPRTRMDGVDRGSPRWTGTNGASARESYSAAVIQYVDPCIQYQLVHTFIARPGSAHLSLWQTIIPS
jgi:hypothetical protein